MSFFSAILSKTVPDSIEHALIGGPSQSNSGNGGGNGGGTTNKDASINVGGESTLSSTSNSHNISVEGEGNVVDQFGAGAQSVVNGSIEALKNITTKNLQLMTDKNLSLQEKSISVLTNKYFWGGVSLIALTMIFKKRG